MQASPPALIEKNVVLLGAGNAHLRFVRLFGMHPLPGVAVTLVSEAPEIPYSAMAPGHIAGDYRRDEVAIDLVRLCRAMGCRFLPARAERVDVAERRVEFGSRPPLRFDVLCLGVGSSPVRPPGLTGENSWLMRPLDQASWRLDALEASFPGNPPPLPPSSSAAGRAGASLSLAIKRRLARFPAFCLTLIQANDRLLPGFPRRTADLFSRRLAEEGVAVRLDTRVGGGGSGKLNLSDGTAIAYDAVLWATNGGPPAVLRDSGLRLTEEGFLAVADTLQSLSEPSVFGTGDCIGLPSYPDLPKNGVYAVRQGGALFDNVSRFLRDKALRPWVPQRLCLVLLNTADGSAALAYGPLSWSGRLVRRLKEWIDRRWVEKFTRFPAMAAGPGDEAPLMRCGGCGSKISGDVLSAVLRRLDVGDDPRVLLGTKAGEDASVHVVRPELFGDPARLVEVQTVDHFKAFVDDPYLFGQVAALHSLSDLYAMNARPFTALAIATLPYARGLVQEGMLFELLSGAVEVFRRLGVTLTGGHTTEGADLSLGFAVTGHGEENQLFRKAGLRPGDRLVLTKPLGSGALLAAWMRGECPAGWFSALTRHLLVANAKAGEVFARHGVAACTDVTGFGLAGHLLEMLDASGMAARLSLGKIPVYEGFTEVVRRGIVSTLHADNHKAACRVVSSTPPAACLFDPQTSGGLLAGVPPEVADEVVRELIAEGYEATAVIGEVLPLAAQQTSFVQLAG
ncbi:MAG: selenide, water dikinase SelD [Gemmataceae bacterium]